MVCGPQLLAAIRFILFYLGRGVRERWCVAHPCLVWENLPWWWFEFKGRPRQSFRSACDCKPEATCVQTPLPDGVYSLSRRYVSFFHIHIFFTNLFLFQISR